MNLKGVTTGTWVRIIVLSIALINQVLVSVFNFKLPIVDDQQLYENVSQVATIAVALWTSWKNNSITKEAQEADQIIRTKKGVK